MRHNIQIATKSGCSIQFLSPPTSLSIVSAVRVLSPIAEAFCRPSKYSIRLRKHSVGRGSTSSDCGSILPAVRVLHPIAEAFCRPWEYSIRLKHASCRPFEYFRSCSRYSVGRESSFSFRGSILSAVTMLSQKEEVLCRPWECFCVSKICALSFRQCKVTNISWDIRQNGPSEHTN